MMSGATQRIRITSDPPGARVNLDGKEYTTPASVNLKRGNTYNVSAFLDGYEPGRRKISNTLNPWMVGTLVLFWPALAIDFISGSGLMLTPDEIHFNLSLIGERPEKETGKEVETPPELKNKPNDFKPLPEAKRPMVAVFNFEDQTPKGKAGYGKIVAELFHSALYQTKCFRLIERERLKNLIAEQKLGNTELFSEDQAVQIGKLLKVEYVLLGSIAKMEKQFVLTARLIRVSTGETAAAAPSTKAKSADEIDTVVNSMANNLGTQFR